MLRFWRLVVGASCVCLLATCSLGQGTRPGIGTFVLDGRTYAWTDGMSAPSTRGLACDGKPAGSADALEFDVQFSKSVNDLGNNVWIYVGHPAPTGTFSGCTLDLNLDGVFYASSTFTVTIAGTGGVGGMLEGSFAGDIMMGAASHRLTGSFSVMRAPDGIFRN